MNVLRVMVAASGTTDSIHRHSINPLTAIPSNSDHISRHRVITHVHNMRKRESSMNVNAVKCEDSYCQSSLRLT